VFQDGSDGRAQFGNTHSAGSESRKLFGNIIVPDTALPSGSLSAISRTFHPLSKALFSFPSRYLFAIGLSFIFSLRWSLPPTSNCNPKQSDSTSRAERNHSAAQEYHPLRPAIPGQLGGVEAQGIGTPTHNSAADGHRFQGWAVPSSLAVTAGILVSFFSSAY
jgi:hypothetical protein